MTPLQAAARLALEKKVLSRKHCVMVSVENANRKRKRMRGSL
jgi:hypothetical protein